MPSLVSRELTEAEKASLLWGLVRDLVKERGASYKAMDLLIEIEGMEIRRDLASRVVEAEKTRMVWLPLQAKYDSLEGAIKAGGYDYCDQARLAEIFWDVNEFAVDGEVALYKPLDCANNQQVLEKLDSLGLRSSTLVELLALAEVYPGIELSFSIGVLPAVGRKKEGRAFVLLKSDSRGEMAVSYGLGKSRRVRCLYLCTFDNNAPSERILVARK
jgi:hypothetical protein